MSRVKLQCDVRGERGELVGTLSKSGLHLRVWRNERSGIHDVLFGSSEKIRALRDLCDEALKELEV